MGKDPALVSGIFLTTVTDMLGFGLMFGIARLLDPRTTMSRRLAVWSIPVLLALEGIVWLVGGSPLWCSPRGRP